MIPLGNWLTILGLDLTILGPGLGLSHFGSHVVMLMAKLGPYRVILGPNLAILGPDFVVLSRVGKAKKFLTRFNTPKILTVLC